jgi:hypothetical protein
MRNAIAVVGVLVLVYACGADKNGVNDAASGADGGEAPNGGTDATGGAAPQAGSHSTGGGKGGVANGGEAGSEMPSGGSAAGEPTGGAAGEANGGAAGVDNQVVLEQTKFLDYGVLRVGFTLPVDAATLELALTPRVPSKLMAAEIKQVDATTVDALLLDYHLPRDYELTVSGELDDGTPFQTVATLPGLDNGARVAFLTKQSGLGDLMSWPGAPADAATPRDAADGICQAEADAVGLRGTFVAFLSKLGSYDAGCRAFGLDGLLGNKCGQQVAPVDDAPWLGTTGLPIVEGASNIVSGSFQNAFAFYADGTRSQQVGIWTGTVDGAKAQTGAPGPNSADCGGWTATTNYAEVTEFVGEYLLKYGEFGSGCASAHRLLCLQTGGEFFGPSTLHQVSGKRTFVSKGQLTGAMSFGGKTGVDAADALCQAEAAGATYANAARFHAYLSTTQTDAICHILGLTGKVGTKCGLDAFPDADPWRRADDYPVGTAAQLVKSDLTAPIALAPDESAQSTQWPWTGTSSNGAAGTTCTDWSSGAFADTGFSGTPRALTNGWSLYTDSHCNSPQPVYCFEQ